MRKAIFKKFWKFTAIGIGVTGTIVTPLFANFNHAENQRISESEYFRNTIKSLYPSIFTPISEESKTNYNTGKIVETPSTIYASSPISPIAFKDTSDAAKAIFHQYRQMYNGYKRLGFEKKDLDSMEEALVYIGSSVEGFLPDSWQSKYEDGVKLFSDKTKIKDIVEKKNGISKITANDTIRVYKPKTIVDVFTAGAFSATAGKEIQGNLAGQQVVFDTEPESYIQDDTQSEEEYRFALQRYATSDRFPSLTSSEFDANDKYLNNFMWKVGVIDVKQMVGTQAFSFSVKDTGDEDADNRKDADFPIISPNGKKDIEIVITNADDLLVQNFGAADSTYRSIDDLIKSEYIFIRDVNQRDGNAFDLNTDPSANHGNPSWGEMKWADNIYFARSGATDSRIDIYIKPKNYHISGSVSNNFYFELSIPDAMKTTEFVKKNGLTFGVLDHSYNPEIIRPIERPISLSNNMWTANDNMWTKTISIGAQQVPINDNVNYLYNQDPQWIISSFKYSSDFNDLGAPSVSTLGDYFPRTWNYSSGFINNTNYTTWRIYHSGSNWRQLSASDSVITGVQAEQMRFFMYTGTEMEFNFRIKKSTGGFVEKNYFEGGSDALKILYDYLGNTPSVTEREYVIDENVFQNIFEPVVGEGVQPQYVSVKTYPALNVSSGVPQYYAKVDIILTKGQVMLNPDVLETSESIMWLDTVSNLTNGNYQRIFFTPPRGTRPDTNIQGLDTVKFGSKSRSDNYYEQIVANVFGIWSGHRNGGIDYNEVKFVLDNNIYKWYSQTSSHHQNGSIFPFNYNSYYYTQSEGLIFKGVYSEIVEEDADGKDIYFGNDPKILPSTGYNVTYKLNDYSNKLSLWTENVLGVQAETALNKYKINAFAEAIPFYTNEIENNTLVYGPRIMQVAKVLYKYWKGQNLNTEESILLAEINSLAESRDANFNVISYDISEQGKDKNGPDNIDNPNDPYTRSLAIIYEIVSWYWADALVYLIQYEQNQFELIKGTILGRYMGSYLSDLATDSIAINAGILKKVPLDKLLPGHDVLNLLILGNTPVVTARSGYEELKSLLDFIHLNGLHAKYLNKENSDIFNSKYDSLIDPDSYINPTKIQESRSLIRLLDIIIREIIGGESNVKSLSDIVNAILDGTIVTSNPTIPVDEIRHTIRAAIQLITDQKTEYKYSYFGIYETTNYLENIVIGNNLGEAIKLYITKNEDKLSDDEIDRLNSISGREAYSPETITKIAINLKYYNLRLYLDKLLDENRVSSIVEEIARSKLVEIDDIDIPKSNDFLNYLSNPEAISSFVMAFIGFILVAISVFSLFTSFKKYVKQGGRSIIITRLIFIILLSIGLVIAGLGILPLIGVI